MKVILQQGVDKLGGPGDVVDVADGYARNYLIPRKLAAPASKGAVKHVHQLRTGHEERVRKALAEARSQAETLSGTPVRVAARAGDDGRLFGSITVNDVVEQLRERAGVAIDRRQVHLPEPIRSLGTHEVEVRLHPEVTAAVTLEVVRQ